MGNQSKKVVRDPEGRRRSLFRQFITLFKEKEHRDWWFITIKNFIVKKFDRFFFFVYNLIKHNTYIHKTFLVIKYKKYELLFDEENIMYPIYYFIYINEFSYSINKKYRYVFVKLVENRLYKYFKRIYNNILMNDIIMDTTMFDIVSNNSANTLNIINVCVCSNIIYINDNKNNLLTLFDSVNMPLDNFYDLCENDYYLFGDDPNLYDPNYDLFGNDYDLFESDYDLFGNDYNLFDDDYDLFDDDYDLFDDSTSFNSLLFDLDDDEVLTYNDYYKNFFKHHDTFLAGSFYIYDYYNYFGYYNFYNSYNVYTLYNDYKIYNVYNPYKFYKHFNNYQYFNSYYYFNSYNFYNFYRFDYLYKIFKKNNFKEPNLYLFTYGKFYSMENFEIYYKNFIVTYTYIQNNYSHNIYTRWLKLYSVTFNSAYAVYVYYRELRFIDINKWFLDTNKAYILRLNLLNSFKKTIKGVIRKLLRFSKYLKIVVEMFYGNYLNWYSYEFSKFKHTNIYVWYSPNYHKNVKLGVYNYNYTKAYLEITKETKAFILKWRTCKYVFWGEGFDYAVSNMKYIDESKIEFSKKSYYRKLTQTFLRAPYWLEKITTILAHYFVYYRRKSALKLVWFNATITAFWLQSLYLFMLGVRLRLTFLLSMLNLLLKYMIKLIRYSKLYLNNFFFRFYKKEVMEHESIYRVHFKLLYINSRFKKQLAIVSTWENLVDLLNRFRLSKYNRKAKILRDPVITVFYKNDFKSKKFKKFKKLNILFKKLNVLFKMRVLNQLTNKLFQDSNSYFWYVDIGLILHGLKGYTLSSIKYTNNNIFLTYYPYGVMGNYEEYLANESLKIDKLNYKIKPGILTLDITGGYYWKKSSIYDFNMRKNNLMFNNVSNIINDSLKYFSNNLSRGLVSLWKLFNTIILCIILVLSVMISLLFFKSLMLTQIYFLIICVFYFIYLIISGFVYFVKKNKFSKFTSVIQRFWRRSFIIFWLIESSLFLVFLYLILNSSGESMNILDNMQIYKLHLFSWRFFLIKNFLIGTIVLLLLLLMQKIKVMYFNKILKILFVISLFVFYLCWVEFYQFYHTLCYYANYIWVYDNEDRVWSICLDVKQTRVFNSYYNLCVILKFWHLIFIIFFWVFFLMRSLEDQRIRYPLLATNCQNFIILYVMSWLCMVFWLKYILKRFMEGSYSWFFLNFSKNTVNFFLSDFVLIYRTIILDIYEYISNIIYRILSAFYYKYIVFVAIKNFFLDTFKFV